MTINKVPLIWESNLIDINNDIGFTKISSIINEAPEDIKEVLNSVLQRCQQRGIMKEASINSNAFLFKGSGKLPINSYDDLVLTKLYFKDQKNNIPSDIYKKADATLDALLNIYNIPDSYFTWGSELDKVADDNGINDLITYLLPDEQLFPVYNKEDLMKVASIYTDNENNFLLNQKIEFSRNFVRKALEFNDTNIPANIAKYASALDTDFASTYQYIEKRANWIDVHCTNEESTVTKLRNLASDILKIAQLPEKEQLAYKDDINSLNKLAYHIAEVDARVGIGDKQYRKKIFPDAFGTIFNKVAGDVIGRGYTANDTPGEYSQNRSDKVSILNDVDKATIVATFGDEVLEDLEDSNGELDQERAKKLLVQTGMVNKDKGI